MNRNFIRRRLALQLPDPSPFQNNLLRFPLELYVPNEGAQAMLDLLTEVEKSYRIVWLWKGSELATHRFYSIVCTDELHFSLCYWYIGQLWAVMIQPFINDYQKRVINEKNNPGPATGIR